MPQLNDQSQSGLPPLPPGLTLDQPQSAQPQDQQQGQQLPPLPPGLTLDQPRQQPPRSQRQVAAGGTVPTVSQVAAGGGAAGVGSIVDSVNEYIDKQAQPFWDSADRAHDALQTALGHFEDHLKNLAAGVAGIKRLPAPPPTPPPKPAQPTARPETTGIWQAFQGDTGLNKLADHVISMEGDSQIARENNNPGNLKDPKTDELMQFGSYEEGRSALLKQLIRWRDKNPNWSIADFNRNYAPDKSHGGDNPAGTEASRNQYLMNISFEHQAPAPAQAEVDPPPGFIIEPKPEDFASLPADVQAVQRAGEYLKPAAKVVGGMATTAAKVSTPYIAWQIYKKLTGQPNELAKIPGNAIKTFGLALVGGPEETAGEAVAPEAAPAQAPVQAPSEAPVTPTVPPRQLPMPVMEGEYMPSPSAGALPPGQYAQPPVQQRALPPGQYAPAAPVTRPQLPARASAIPLPESFPGPRPEPFIRTTPSEPLEPLTTREEPAVAKAKPPKAKAKAQPPAVEAKAPAAAERTAVGTEGEVKGMRLVQREGKWYNAETGEEYQWKVRRRTGT